MAINHTGDPTLTQAPSPSPASGNTPIASVPVDGDARNAASISQALKMLTDFAAWARAPIANISAWAQHLHIWRNARGQQRFIVDHHGFPAGAFLQWQDHWKHEYVLLGSPVTAMRERYFARLSAASGVGGSVEAVGVLEDGLRNVGLINAAASGNYAGFDTADASGIDGAIVQRNPDAAFSLEFLISARGGGGEYPYTGMDYFYGFTGDIASTSDIATTVAAARYHVGFTKRSTDTNWQAKTDATFVDTGIAPVTGAGSRRRFKIVFLGQNVSDDSTRRALFYIDDALVANMTAGLSSDQSLNLVMTGRRITTAAGTGSAYIGPMRFTRLL